MRMRMRPWRSCGARVAGAGARGRERSRPSRGRRSHAWQVLACAAALAGTLALAAGPASAVSIPLGPPPSGPASLSDAAAHAFDGFTISTALVVSEAHAQALTLLPAVGNWAASPGGQGLLNTFEPEIRFRFDDPVASFAVHIVGLPQDGGAPQAVRLRAFLGDVLVGSLVSDPAQLDAASGFHEQVLSLASLGAFDRVVAEPVTENPLCTGPQPCYGIGPTSSFWLDDASFTPVPEPGSAALLLAGIGALGALRGARAR